MARLWHASGAKTPPESIFWRGDQSGSVLRPGGACGLAAPKRIYNFKGAHQLRLMSHEGRHIAIRGIVQGVGFRPWVYRLAVQHGLGGWVRNDASGVTIEIFGPAASLDAFVRGLHASPPPAARLHAVLSTRLAPRAVSAFEILGSEPTDVRRVSIPADLPTCDDCLAELRDPANRRYRYPFTNCTNCGPRFTIAFDVPYDRPKTTMAPFVMCATCQARVRLAVGPPLPRAAQRLPDLRPDPVAG